MSCILELIGFIQQFTIYHFSMHITQFIISILAYNLVQFFSMNTNVAQQFQNSLKKFSEKQKQLPQRIRFKLNYISCLIKGEKPKTEELPEEYLLQIQDLSDVNTKGLMVIFNSIVQTLFMQDLVIDKQCQIKRKGFFKPWTNAYIKYDDQHIFFNYSSKTTRFRFKNVEIKQNKSSKRSFDFYYKKQFQMTVKFVKQESMKIMLKKIQEFILSQKNKIDQMIIQNLKEKVNNKSNINKNQSAFIQRKTQKKKVQQQIQEHMSKSAVIKQLEFERTEYIPKKQNNQKITESKQLKLNSIQHGYELKHKTRNVSISMDAKLPKLHIELLIKHVQNLSLAQTLSCLANYKGWNSNVTKQNLVYQMKSNRKATMYRVYKKGNSFMSSERQTYTLLQYKRLDKKMAILIQQSLQNQDVKQSQIRAYIRTIAYLETYENNARIFIQAEYDPKGFCQRQQARDLLYAMYFDLIHFQTYLRTCSIQNSQQMSLFQEIQNNSHSPISSRQDFDLDEAKNQKKISGNKSSDEDFKYKQPQEEILPRRESSSIYFNELKLLSPKDFPKNQYIEMVIKKIFQKAYLKSTFTFNALKQYDDYLPWYCLEQLLRKGGQYEVTETKQLRFINQALIQSQKDTLKFIIRQIGANIISGKSVLNVSLPVDIFEPRTLLQRSAASLGKMPDYLIPASNMNPLEQIKRVTAFLATVPTLQLIMAKPFNPILGQTFQCYLKGIPLYYQQTSHHPPISSYYMTCPQFTLHGNLVAFADLGLNSGVGGNLGVMHIKFKNGTHFECYFPPSQISGLIYGQRKFRSYGRGYILQRKQKIFSQFSIQKTKKGIYQSKDKPKPGSIIGGIFKINNKLIQFLDSFDTIKKFPGLSKQHIQSKLVHISGIWFDDIYMDQELITKNVRAYPVQYTKNCLPSDSNFRLDVLFHKQNNLTQSQKQKEVGENLQRDDRKLRQKWNKKKK